ncbi:MAG: amino acid-binding protein [Armatimonadota bacterium]|nr:amino acid-binding protein [Armatimonadota bacterium]MDR5675154.1 amino acid-binding protein [Armatimonadota bacterium]MDR7386263.1 amino acid-binding protein [Armatimonadota bacterium]MDR7389721.1 amino acid-binding protein [Armatimonadota bacterium]MDR7390934.1 amino acid-binding protein [Armatimonadota bacterium]
MPKDLQVELLDRPGTLARLGEALGRAGVNIEGFCGVPFQGKGRIHVLVEDAAAARRALEEAGIPVVAERDVLVVDVVDQPGTLGSVARKLADAGVNIDWAYLATRTRLVLAVSDLDRARSVLS